MNTDIFLNNTFDVLSFLYDIKNENNIIRITQQEVADELHMSRITVNKTFNLLKDNNYIIQDKTHVGMYILTQNALFLMKSIKKINKTNRNECRDKEGDVYEN